MKFADDHFDSLSNFVLRISNVKAKKISDKSISEYIKQKLAEKELFLDALRMGKDIKELARERGIELVQPV